MLCLGPNFREEKSNKIFLSRHKHWTDLPLLPGKQSHHHDVTIQGSVAGNHSINKDIASPILDKEEKKSTSDQSILSYGC